jgi:tRNA (guanine-N7-)-methyltransferase
VRTTRRRGRTSAAKEAAVRDLLPRYAPTPADHLGPVALDIGVGDGAATAAWAAARPELIVLALELHRPGLAKLLVALDEGGPSNVRVAEADAVEVLRTLAADAPGSLVAIRLLFPDPWPKRRHVARRIVDRAFVRAAADALAADGELHVSTDWDDYADHAASMVATEARFEPLPPDRAVPRPRTAYERRGIAAGRTITDLVWRRR